MKKIVTGIGIITAFTLFVLFFTHQASAPSNDTSTKPTQQSADAPGFNKQLHSTTEPGSIWWIVSKVRPLEPATYAPGDLVTPNVPLRVSKGDSEMRLRKEAATALEQMVKDAKKVNIDLMLASGYRSYQLQVAVYNANVQKYGQAGADKQSARPGTSEHQTGLAADLEPTTRQCEIEACFADLPEGKWLVANGYKYGFLLRYPEGKQVVTGYQYEPWHIRYIGKDLAAELHKQNIQTLEEFFGVVPASQPY